ncbi:hypothetical protein [Parasitella parasitica]|uniref:Uncharacterized protein n=1 Tax=Parasitella parasitica TaxID=35722 RepID=A0A0B7NEB2_9FUNG|nr:hypothetical protein [Parasitella parasitica]
MASKERFNPYDRKRIQQKVANETPNEFVKLLSRQPPTNSKFIESRQSIQSGSDTTEYKRPQPQSPILFSTAHNKPKNAYSVKPIEQRYHLFQKKNRHVELADDALSVVSELTTNQYSRFDRLFEPSTKSNVNLAENYNTHPFQRSTMTTGPTDAYESRKQTNNLEQTAPIFEHIKVLKRQYQSQEQKELDRDTAMEIDRSYDGGTPIETTSRPLFHNIPLATHTQETVNQNTQKSLFHDITPATQEERETPMSLAQIQTRDQMKLQTYTQTQTRDSSPIVSIPAPSPSSSPPPAAPISFEEKRQNSSFENRIREAQENMYDDNDYYGGGGGDYDDDYLEYDRNVDAEPKSALPIFSADDALDDNQHEPMQRRAIKTPHLLRSLETGLEAANTAQQSKRKSETARSKAYLVRLFASTPGVRDESPPAPQPAIETEMEPPTLP